MWIGIRKRKRGTDRWEIYSKLENILGEGMSTERGQWALLRTSYLSITSASTGTLGQVVILGPPVTGSFTFFLFLRSFIYCSCCSTTFRGFLSHPHHPEVFHQLTPELWAPCLPTRQNNGGPHPQLWLVTKVLPSQWQLRRGWDLTKPYLWPIWGYVTYARHVLKACKYISHVMCACCQGPCSYAYPSFNFWNHYHPIPL